jgi:nicotine oxidoreductase
MDCDALVVGGGFAGVTAARELTNRGLRTVLLEARDRLGGRTWTTDFAGGTVEMGGTWIHWNQPHVWAEMTRYGLPVVRDSFTFDVAVFGSPPRRHPPVQAFAKVRDVFSRFASADHSILPYPHDPLQAISTLRDRDLLSMQDRLDEMQMSKADQEWITGLLYQVAGSPLNEAAMTSILRWLALGGWDIDKYFEDLEFRPAGGTISLIDAMLSGKNVDVRLSSPVTAVKVSKDGVRVTTRDGKELAARAGVIAVPVNLLSTIEFTPALPESHRKASAEGMGKPHMDKVFVHARGDIGRLFAQLPAPEPLNIFFTQKQDGDEQLIVGINSNPSLDVNDKEQVAATIRRHVPEIEEVLDVRAHAWAADPYSLGGNTCYRPGQLTRYLAAFLQPVGPLAFAGADIATGYFGNIDGAIESGMRAARMVCESERGRGRK